MKNLIFLVARMGSTRLPRKVLLEVHGKPIIAHQIERIRCAREPEGITLCTTTLAQDDELAALVASLGVEVFRGSPTDVPRRLLTAANAADAPFFVVVEGDEAFVDAAFIDAVFRRAREAEADYVKTRGIPIGAWVYGLSRRALQVMCSEVRTEGLDGWCAFFEKDSRFRVETVQSDPFMTAQSEALRLTLDYPADFKLLQAIYDRLYQPGRVFSLEDVLVLFRSEPNLADINRHLHESYWQRIRANSQGV